MRVKTEAIQIRLNTLRLYIYMISLHVVSVIVRKNRAEVGDQRYFWKECLAKMKQLSDII